MARSDVKMVLELAESLGFEVTRAKNQHYCFRKPGLPAAFFSCTPSDSRAYKNGMAKLRRLDRGITA